MEMESKEGVEEVEVEVEVEAEVDEICRSKSSRRSR